MTEKIAACDLSHQSTYLVTDSNYQTHVGVYDANLNAFRVYHMIPSYIGDTRYHSELTETIVTYSAALKIATINYYPLNGSKS